MLLDACTVIFRPLVSTLYGFAVVEVLRVSSGIDLGWAGPAMDDTNKHAHTIARKIALYIEWIVSLKMGFVGFTGYYQLVVRKDVGNGNNHAKLHLIIKKFRYDTSGSAG